MVPGGFVLAVPDPRAVAKSRESQEREAGDRNAKCEHDDECRAREHNLVDRELDASVAVVVCCWNR